MPTGSARSPSTSGGSRALPHEVREHRLLATAYVSTHDYPQGPTAGERRLAPAPNNAQPRALRGETNAGLGDPEGALADRRRALELEGEDISALHSTAFLLKCPGA